MCNLGMAVEMRGVEKGLQKGRAEGIMKTLVDLFKEGLPTLAQASQKANMSPEEFQLKVNEQQ